MRLSEKLANVRKVNIREIFMDTIQAEEKTILDKNRGQLSRGKTAEGNDITPEYSDRYAEYKGFSTPDLYLTGDFYSEFVLQEQTGTFHFGSADWKSPILIDKYGIEIFGLTDRNMVEFINRTFYPQMMRRIRRYV
jgi:hypothetical protein